jgi:hypothetical protein
MLMITKFQIFIKEGLIISTSNEKMVNVLRKSLKEYPCMITSGGIDIYDEYYMNQMYSFKAVDNNKINGIDVKKVDNFIRPFGWFISSIITTENVKLTDMAKYTEKILSGKYSIKIKQVSIEQKFGDEMKDFPNTLYHITDQKFIPKIKEKGLIPRYMGKRTIHPERIYLCDEYGLSQLYGEFKSLLEKPTTISIDMSKLTIKLFQDNNFQLGGYYTLENIPPKYIDFNPK